MILPLFAQWVLGIASFLAAAGVIYAFGRRIYRIDAAMPVLQQIAVQFNPEADVDNRTLYQRLVAIEETIRKIENIDRCITHIEEQLRSIKSDITEVRRVTNGK